MNFNTMHDVQMLLKRYGQYVYGPGRLATLELMEIEVKELYEAGMLEREDYLKALMVLKSEIRKESQGGR
ncbi:YqgQ family protein [Jeotgalibacillus haloalkalitolerans]|uniref:YqgQ family protein n=1 Tax=Jeotgalibacillus haloalkalitolerans TaxID=3104292 RepID=A0ABU5KLM6_9BACL|nr:YqgQ family protein [Jeotgalibacillus sp. HH7-29]MDZ5712164.1 YqgQ family protein [Jeotgalibacillus sp. HH7-29]